MNLLEALQAYPDDQPVKIGTVDGGGYWYLGTVGDVRQRTAILNDACYEYAVRLHQNAIKSIDFLTQNPPTHDRFMKWQKRIALNLDTEPDFSPESYEKFKAKYAHDKKRAELYKKKTAQRVSTYVSLYDREVLDIADCIDVADPGVVRVVITGYEHGACWVMAEAKEFPAVMFLPSGRKNKTKYSH